MGNNTLATTIYNSTQETVKVCLSDTNNHLSDRILVSGETWTRKTEAGWNSIGIIPLNSNQNAFSYTLVHEWGVVIKRKLGKLVLIPSKTSQCEKDVTLRDHNCFPICVGDVPDYTCRMIGCVIYNECYEPIKVSITDNNRRNTHIILDHGEHNEVRTPKSTSVIENLFSHPKNCAPIILVSVVDFNSDDGENDLIAKAKYSIKSYIHNKEENSITFLRVTKKDGYFNIEEDILELSRNNDLGKYKFSYLFSKEGCQKIRSIKGWYDIIEKKDGTCDIVRSESLCCIM